MLKKKEEYPIIDNIENILEDTHKEFEDGKGEDI